MEDKADYITEANAMMGKGYTPSSNIVRVRKDARYFVASSVPFNDSRLTWEARGIMGYLLSKPDAWETRMGDLVNQGPAGMKFIRRVLAELRQCGYMTRKQVRLEHGKWGWITTLYESPELNNSTIYPLGIDGSRIDAQRVDIISTDVKINDNKENTPKEETTPASTYQPDEQEISSNLKELCALHEKHLPGMITLGMRDLLIDCAKTYPARFYEPAFVAATAQNARKWSFVSVCIKNAADGVERKPTGYKPKNNTAKPSTPIDRPAGVMYKGVWVEA